jgi:hypothetical protein
MFKDVFNQISSVLPISVSNFYITPVMVYKKLHIIAKRTLTFYALLGVLVERYGISNLTLMCARL